MASEFLRDVCCLSVALVITTSCDGNSQSIRSIFGSGGAQANADAGGLPVASGGASGFVRPAGGSSGASGPSDANSSGFPGSSGAPGFSGSPGGGLGGHSGAGNSSGKGPPDASVPGTGGASSGSFGGGSSTDSGDVSTGVLPPIMDPGATGPFTPVTTSNIGPNNQYTSIQPMELGKGGIKHPILVWSPGAGANPAIYKTLLDHIASHGFVIISYNATAQGPELTTAIDWIVTESTRQGSPYLDKVDTKKIAAGGQSAGSLATFNIAKDARLTTTLHINGGTFAPHTAVANLVKVALFICGDDPAVTGGDGIATSDLARPNCDADFMMTMAPVWYGDVIGASHTTIIDNPLSMSMTPDPLKKPFLAATVAWMRWLLADDLTMKPLFIGPNCGYCKEPMTWKVQQKNLP